MDQQMHQQMDQPIDQPMDQSEPPSTAAAPSSRMFHIGMNNRGNWVVQDPQGLCGGLFVDRAEALRFAMFENGRRPQAVIMVPGILELEIGGDAPAAGTLGDESYAASSRGSDLKPISRAA